MGPPWLGDYTRLAWQAALHTFKFSGRSTRTEFGAYYLASALLALLLSAMFGFAFRPETQFLSDKIVNWVLTLPLIALFARRMHDQDRTGWWTLLPLAIGAYNLAAEVIANSRGIEARIKFEQATWIWTWLALPVAIAFVMLFLMPGSPDQNRYGPNPRDSSKLNPP